MYRIYADDTLIYDSTIDDYKLNKASISLEANKSGSFSFSLYPEHFYYDKFVKLKTVITVYKSDRIVFRGRILNEVVDYWNNKVLTCEGELGFLQDSIIRPYTFSGTPTELVTKIVNEHNAQVDDFKKFKIGSVTVVDPNNYIARSSEGYESALTSINTHLLDSGLGGYLYITHGVDGTEEAPTLNYLSDFTNVSTQSIEFGSNLKNYTKTVKAEEIATAIIPLGAETNGTKLTIASVNNNKDYVYNSDAVALRGWIFKTVEFNDVTIAKNLKSKAEEYLASIVNQNITIELNAIDLHLLDRNIESFNLYDYISVISEPHNFNNTMLCTKQTLDLLKPENDTITLGYTYSTFTESVSKTKSTINNISNIQSTVNSINNRVLNVDNQLVVIENKVDSTNLTTQELEAQVRANTNNIEINKTNISAHIDDKTNPHDVTKAQVGLSNVDNTSDANKPVSTAQQTAINTALSTSKEYTDTKVANLVGTAPETLNTLEELAQAIEDNEDVVETLNNAIGNKADKSELEELRNSIGNNTGDGVSNTHISDTNNPHNVTKSQVGLGNVDNTSDLNKPISTATQNALNAKADTTYVDYRDSEILKQTKAIINDNVFNSKTINLDNISIDANGTVDISLNTNIGGSELTGLLGYNISNASTSGYGGSYATVYKVYPSSNGSEFNVSIRNLNTSKAIKIRVYLYFAYAMKVS
jgi:hypothetical protein